ncbi:hypothetical protein V1517DRAFT_355549 [Lipomyces orientalis]|uniref:Uncharacterized protein n=1 Tax=Lipomyces orientalis TaxID=1233043 RepID=A0ACC3TC78_9ASCO
MEPSGFSLHGSNYSQKCVFCFTLVCGETLQDLQKMFTTADGRPAKTCKRCRDNAREKSIRVMRRSSFDLDEQFENYDEFIEILSSFMGQRDGHIFDPDAHANDVSVAKCAQSSDENLQKRAIKCFRNDLSDCTGYYFHLRRCNERVDGPRFSLACSRSNERKTLGAAAKEFFDCHGNFT